MRRREGRSLPSCTEDVGDVRNLLDATSKIEMLFEGADWLNRTLRVDPSAVTLVNLEDLGLKRIDLPAIARHLGLLSAPFSLLRWQMIEEAFAILYDESIQVDQCADAIRDSVGSAADHPTSIGMTAENHIGQFFPSDEVDDVKDMGGKTYRRRSKVAPFAYSGKRGRKDIVSSGGERFTYSFPAPASVP